MAIDKSRVKTIRYTSLSLYKYLENKDQASLQWANRDGYPRIVVYTSKINRLTPAGKVNYGYVITAPFDYISFGMFADDFEDLVKNGKKNESIKLDCFNIKYDNGIKTNELYLQAVITVGIDENGVYYIKVTESGKLEIKFDLLPDTKWYNRYLKTLQDGSGGTKIEDKAVISKKYAKSYLRFLRVCFDTDASDTTSVVSYIDKRGYQQTNNYPTPAPAAIPAAQPATQTTPTQVPANIPQPAGSVDTSSIMEDDIF